MTLQADAAYMKTRVDLESFELSAFAALRSFIPDYYKDGRDDTYWGGFLRSLAIPLGQLNFKTQYDLISHDPAYANPADLLRQFQGPLSLSRNYPGLGQYDLALKQMILSLLAAYRQGCTLGSIEDVLDAFIPTGGWAVQEMFKAIGTTADISDRHTLKVSVPLQALTDGPTVLTTAMTGSIVQDVYTALDLAKPAHVGMNLITMLNDGDALDGLILGIQDDLLITFLGFDGDPTNVMLTLGGGLAGATTGKTGIAPAILSPSYQWFVIVPGQAPAALAGQTSAILTLSGVTVAMNGNAYYLVATDPNLGTVCSTAAVLQVSTEVPLPILAAPLPAPVKSTGTLEFTTQPFCASVHPGVTVNFSALLQNAIVPGHLSPHLNRTWEVVNDSLVGLDLD